MQTPNLSAIRSCRPVWNKGRIVGQKRPLLPKHIRAIRVRLEIAIEMDGGTTNGRLRIPLATALPRTASYFDTAICASGAGLGEINRAGAERVRQQLGESDELCQ